MAQFAPLARLPGVRLISLQKGFGSEQIAAVDFPVLDLSDRLDEAAGPFMDTAAVIRNLDLVVTADTAIAHLAGALGAPVWLALQLSPDWRWLLGRDDSPWYPTMRLFRQTTFGQWPDVFERIAEAAARHCRSETGKTAVRGRLRSYNLVSGIASSQRDKTDDNGPPHARSSCPIGRAHRLGPRQHRAGGWPRRRRPIGEILALRARHRRGPQQPRRLARQSGQARPGRARFEQALALRPDYADAHNNLGNVFRRQGRLDQAAAHAIGRRPPCGPATSKRIPTSSTC